MIRQGVKNFTTRTLTSDEVVKLCPAIAKNATGRYKGELEVETEEILAKRIEVSKKVLDVLGQIIATAKESNKRLILDECWLYKMLPGEGGSVAAAADIYRRDIYDFWEPADELFLEAMAKLASQNHIEYVSPFWSHCFFAHRAYDPADEKLSYQELNAKYLPDVSRNMVSGQFSKTGLFYSDLVKKYGGGGTSK
jgi:hypothetical protein